MTNCTYSTGGKQINKVNESMKQNNGQQYTNNATRHGNTCERNVILWCLLSTYMFPPFSLNERLLSRRLSSQIRTQLSVCYCMDSMVAKEVTLFLETPQVFRCQYYTQYQL